MSISEGMDVLFSSIGGGRKCLLAAICRSCDVGPTLRRLKLVSQLRVLAHIFHVCALFKKSGSQYQLS